MPPGPSLAPPGLVKCVAVFSGEFVDRALHDTLRSHFADHPDVAVVLIVDRIGVHDLNAIAPYGVCAVVRTSELTGRPNLLTTVRATVAQGGYRLPAGLGASVRNTVAGPPHMQRPFGQPGILLKPFELDMVILAAQGRGKSGAAQQLDRTPGYVRNARKDLFQRLGVNTMAACVSYAAREGLLWNDSADGEPS
ncbi:helix-turn-helix transcriptional regulator [Streptomyces anulatus]|uniref:helix-turn-helix transcriptional regulator n=1 Tax=Streptomyces anulatus TaxID=1892 RepID=UPI0033C331D2|nr:DNA-binding response regulator [Streptomyces anulatus]